MADGFRPKGGTSAHGIGGLSSASEMDGRFLESREKCDQKWKGTLVSDQSDDPEEIYMNGGEVSGQSGRNAGENVDVDMIIMSPF